MNTYLDQVAYAKVIETVNSLTSDDFLTDKDKLSEYLQRDIDTLNEELASKGIIVTDLDIYRTILPASNIESTYQKMIAEREAIAQQRRSEGLENYNNTVSDTDRQVAQIKADAILESQTIRGEADAEAIQIYAEGFNKDPEFYEFWRTMRAYESVIKDDTNVYMNSDNDFLNFFNTGN